MTGRPPASEQLPDPSIELTEGWHCSHLYYEFNRQLLANMSAEQISQGRDELATILNPATEDPQRLQVSIVSGNKADFGLMLMDPNPLAIDKIKKTHGHEHPDDFHPAINIVLGFYVIVVHCSHF